MRFDRRLRFHPGRRPKSTAALLILALAAQIVVAQYPTLKTRTKEDRERQFQASHRITINVQVTDDSGKPVTDLDAKDFTILDNHQPRKLAAFHPIDGESMNDATEVIILLDAVNTPTPALEAAKNGIFKYLAQSRSALPYPTSFVLWSNGHLKANAATRDRNAVGRAFVSATKNLHSNACAPDEGSLVRAVEAGGSGSRGDGAGGSQPADVENCLQVHFKDSLAALDGIAQQQLSVGGRTLLIWVGPGWPLLSDAAFHQLTPTSRKNYFDEIVSVLHDLRAAQVTLDAVTPRDAGHEELATMNSSHSTVAAASAESAAPDSLALPVLAPQTGGRVMASTAFVTDLAKLLDDADWYYALSFSSPPAQKGVELRSLEVKVNRPGLNIRTMTCYYTEP